MISANTAICGYPSPMLPPKGVREEKWNSLSHGFGCLLAIIALPLLIIHSARNGDGYYVVSSAVFGLTMILTLGASALYHASRTVNRRRVLRIVDHASIYLLIAGSYTPMCLTTLRGPWGWTLFGVVWGIAVIGVLLKIKFTGRFEVISTILYLAMGWICMIAVVPMFERLQGETLLFLLAAGVFFTGGVVFYMQDRKQGFHFIWHLCVMAGCVGLYGAVYSEIPSGLN